MTHHHIGAKAPKSSEVLAQRNGRDTHFLSGYAVVPYVSPAHRNEVSLDTRH